MALKAKRKVRKGRSDGAQYLKRERALRQVKFSALNAERYRWFWREMLTRAKMPGIVRKVEIAWQTLEHAFDLKDYRYSMTRDR